MIATTPSSIDLSPRYMPLSACAVVSAALVPLAALILLMPGMLIGIPALLAVPLCGIVVAGFSWRAIRRTGGELGGRRLALIGLAGHAVVLVAALGWNFYLYRVINPPGYRSLTFQSLKQPSADDEQFIGQNVAIGGWMFPMRESSGLTRFCLVDHLTGGFGASYRPDEQVMVALSEGTTTDHRSGWLLVTGRFENYDRRFGCPAGDCPKYVIHADGVRVAPVSAELMNQSL